MPLEHILRAMQAQADREIEKILRAADQETAQLTSDAQAQAEAIRARHRARVEPVLLSEAASLQNKSKLGALRAMASAREQLLAGAFAEAESCLGEIRASRTYAAIFQTLAQEALRDLGTEVIAYVDPQDLDLARRVFAELGVQTEIETQPIPLGGLQVAEREGRVVVVNTLASRLERARALLRGPVAEILVEKAEPEKEWQTTTVTPTPA